MNTKELDPRHKLLNVLLNIWFDDVVTDEDILMLANELSLSDEFRKCMLRGMDK